MATTSSNLVDDLAEGTYKIKCKYGHDKKCELCGIKFKDLGWCLEYTNDTDDLLGHKCLCYNKNYQNMFDENLKKRIANNKNFPTMISTYLFFCCEMVFIIGSWCI